MNFELSDGRRRSSAQTSRRSSSVKSDEDSITFTDSYQPTETLRPPGTAVIRRAESSNRRTNLTTGLKVAEHYTKTANEFKAKREQLFTPKSVLKTRSSRPNTSRGRCDSYSHDTRQFIGIIHSKLDALTEEIERLHMQCKSAKQEYTNSLVYECKAKEIAAEITNFQTILADLNLAFDYVNTFNDIDKLETEAKELNEINNFEKDRNEALFCERKLKEDFVHQIELNRVTNQSTYDETKPKAKEKYSNLNNRYSQSSRAVKFWENQIELYNDLREALILDLQNQFSSANEIIKYEIKLLDFQRKCKETFKNYTSKGGDERQKLLEKVKQDKIEISTMEFRLNDINKKINDMQEVIVNTTLSDAGTKEEIDNFLFNVDILRGEQTNKLGDLGAEVEHYLSILQRNLPITPTAIDYINLLEKKNDVNDFSNTTDTVSEKHAKILILFKKMEIMEFTIAQQCKNLSSKCEELNGELEEYTTLSKLNAKLKQQENEILMKRSQLERESPNNLEELEKAKERHEKLQVELSENEKHKEIVYLEERHFELENDILLIKQSIEEMRRSATHLMKIKNDTLSLIEVFNTQLINHSAGV